MRIHAERVAGPAASRVTSARGLQRCGCGHGLDERVPTPVRRSLEAPGEALDGATRALMESRLGHHFGDVRIHADAAGDAAARSVGALALTLGAHVAFAADRYEPATDRGRRLLAHELAHVVQQRAADDAHARAAGAPHEAEADRAAAEVVGGPSGAPPVLSPAAGLQRQAPTAGPSRVDFSSHLPVHVPPCGSFRATTDVAGVTWSLAKDTVAVDAGTTIAKDGAITIGPAQSAGQIKAVAATAGGVWEQPFTIRSHPTGIASTSVISTAGSADYGGVFDHVFTSADGNVASLEGVAVGERFSGVAAPAAATHAIGPPTHPFGGTFTLSTSTLTPDATDNWFLTSAGQLGGTHDNVEIERARINVGRFVQSASNPTPARPLPADMTLTQRLHWYCPQASAATRWRMPAFVTVAHSRTLRTRAGAVEFVTTVNGVEIVQDYDGPVTVFNATASPVSTPHSAAPVAPRTVAITADTLPAALPAGSALAFSFTGPSLGCTLTPDPANDHAATLNVGTSAGSVTVRIADATGRNFAHVAVQIT